MAQLKQCPNGHYYDSGLYPGCPYCSGAGTGIDRSVGTVPPTGGSFDRPVKFSGAAVAPEDYQRPTEIVKPGKLREKEKADSKMDEVPVSNAEDYDLPKRCVVGWLVSVEGPYIGRSFEIYAGNTCIGRNEGDVILKEDEFISGSKNAITVYDDRVNRFFMIAGQSRNLIWVNDKLLLASCAIELKPYDLIEMGMSKFRFVPFCSDQFQW